MRVDLFNYNLPEELIAREPSEKRNLSRLMVVDRQGKQIYHRHFKDATDYFLPGDVLVINDTKVFPARLLGRRKHSGGKIEVL